MDLGSEHVEQLAAEATLSLEPAAAVLELAGRGERELRVVERLVVDLVRPVADVSEDRIRRLDEIDLKSDVEDDVVAVPRDRDDGDEVDERDAALSVVDERRLALLALRQLPLQVRDGNVVGIATSRALGHLAVRG